MIGVRPSEVHSLGVNFLSFCTLFRFNTRLRFNTRSQCRAEGAPLARRRRAVNGHERRRRECAAVHKERQLHGQRYARSEVSTGFMVTSGVRSSNNKLRGLRAGTFGPNPWLISVDPKQPVSFCFAIEIIVKSFCFVKKRKCSTFISFKNTRVRAAFLCKNTWVRARRCSAAMDSVHARHVFST